MTALNTCEAAPATAFDLATPFLLKSGGTRVIEVQPTLRCNLRCAHCYSESGPEHSGELSLSSLAGFMQSAAALGYRYVGVSGGEPLLWSPLEGFLDLAHSTGFSTSFTTNATLLTPARAAALRGRADLVAVSVDGRPVEHAAIRGSARAFSFMKRGLAVLRDAGLHFSLVFTLTRYNADSLPWLCEFAMAEGALGLNVHPLCNFGAASVNLSDATPDSQEFQTASWLLALLVEGLRPRSLSVTLDVMRRAVIEQSCWPMLANDQERFQEAPFSDLVPALVVEPDGCVVPFIYGFPRRFALGFLEAESLAQAAGRWRTACADPVARLIRSTLHDLAKRDAEFVDLFGEVLAAANRAREPMAEEQAPSPSPS
jgi:MoaA/NifB/PqqE/SkfB family radical SAM enzyme